MGIIGNGLNRLNKRGWRLSVTTCNAKAPAYYHISSRVRAFGQKKISQRFTAAGYLLRGVSSTNIWILMEK